MAEATFCPRVKDTKLAGMPLIGYGTYLIENDDAAELVFKAIQAGYRHIDTAQGYSNEEGVGAGFRRAIDELGLAREELFITTKLWPGNEEWGQTVRDYDTTIEACEESLRKLGLEYVDLYLIHAPFAGPKRIDEWRALVELQKRGKVKHIGVSNWSTTHIDELTAAGLPAPDANQIELHPWCQQRPLVGYLEEKGILPIAYSSLAPLSTWRSGLTKGPTNTGKSESMMGENPFKDMADKYGKTEAQVLLRWGVQKGYPVLPRSTNDGRIAQNIDLDFEISESDMAALDALDKGTPVAWGNLGNPLEYKK